jgi:serine/threonine-protein kinase
MVDGGNRADSEADPVATVLDRPAARDDRRGEVTPPPSDETDADEPDDGLTKARGSGTESVPVVGSEAGKSVAVPTTLMTSPLDALHQTEIQGTRTFCRAAIALGVVGFSIVPLLPGNPVASVVMMAAIAVAIIGLVYLHHRTSDPATYYDGSGVAWGWYVPCLGVASAVPYFGPFSPVSILLVLGIYFNALGASARLSLAIYLTCAVTQGVSGALVIADLVDPGFILADNLSLRVQIICQVLIELVLLATYLIARASRRSSLAALTELERAVRAIAQREALLEEAREELRRAVGSGRGRFTDQIIGRYRLGDLIGRGAMGEVYEGTDTTTSQQVAVKMLSQTSLGNAHHVQRFLRELQTAATINSPNVVRVIEVGEQPLPHLVMERLRGRDLARILRVRKAMSHDKVIDLIGQIGAGITAAGAVGVIHRDLKPQNLFLAGTTWKILDFGVSRLADTGDTLTAGHVVGTPAYMAPEQARGGDVDHRTDLYALAAIAYRVLTGHAPFSGGEIADMLYRVVHTAPRRPSSLASLHADVDLVLAIGLAKDPADRFPTAVELSDALAFAFDGALSAATRTRGHALTIDGAWARQLPPRGQR